tara:strand:- start:2486 stop:3076 length:591 start_codon:yes stop_codon:yes gene_type:complete
MDIKQLATLKNAFDRKKELDEFREYLKNNPIQESEYKSLIETLNVDNKEKHNFYNHLSDLKKNGMAIDDIPEEYSDFVERVEKQGLVPIKKSIMKQMNSDEFQQLTSKRFALYDDMNGQEQVIHYKWKGRLGLEETSGNGISVSHTKTNDLETIKNAQNQYKNAKEEIGKILTEIEVNGAKYSDFRVDKKNDNDNG